MQPLNDAWEHFIVTMKAEVNEQQPYFAQRWPGQTFPLYSPLALLPQLDHIGKQGWELVSIQPVVMGVNGDVAILGDVPFGYHRWTNEYLCTFKRRLPHT